MFTLDSDILIRFLNSEEPETTFVWQQLEDGISSYVSTISETELLSYKDLIDQFTILSVNPGKQGQEFLPDAIDRIKKLRVLIPGAIIEVDGGINESNIQEVARAGADYITVGSALKVEDPVRELEKLQTMAGILS